MKKFLLLFGCTLLMLTSCTNKNEVDIVQPEGEEGEGETEISIIPNDSLAEDQYKILLPYRPSAARGAITNQVTNRVDIDELEEGLRRHSTNVFSPKKYVFEEGQYLDTEFIYSLIDSLNPKVKDGKGKKEQIKAFRENPRIFSHILEQNFLEKKEGNTVELVGASIGISLKSVYRFQTEIGGPYYYEDIPENKMIEEGKKIAASVLEEIRDIPELEKVPIMIALFREEEQSSPVSGNFVAKTTVDKGSKTIDKWETINEEHVLFPSERAKDTYFEDYQKMEMFGKKIAEYFPNYVGVAGDGFYVDKNLKRLSIEVPIEFFGKGEVVGFSQYAYGLVKEIFPNHYDIEVIVTSLDGTESLIYRNAGADKPKVHILQ